MESTDVCRPAPGQTQSWQRDSALCRKRHELAPCWLNGLLIIWLPASATRVGSSPTLSPEQWREHRTCIMLLSFFTLTDRLRYATLAPDLLFHRLCSKLFDLIDTKMVKRTDWRECQAAGSRRDQSAQAVAREMDEGWLQERVGRCTMGGSCRGSGVRADGVCWLHIPARQKRFSVLDCV